MEDRPVSPFMRATRAANSPLEEMSEEFKTLKEDESFECTKRSLRRYSPYL